MNNPTVASTKPAPAKTAARKPRTTKAASGSHKTTPNTGEVRHMIATAAYYRALNRGFAAGHEHEDWIAAEQEILQMISS